MKKNFKFMLVALMALVGFNSAMAQALESTTQYANNGLQYKILTLKKATSDFTVSVEQSDWVSKATDKTALTIPGTVKFSLTGTDGNGAAVNEEITFKVVKVAANAFKGLTDIATVTFGTADDPCQITSIDPGAFEGTSISNLNLTNTKITKLEKLFEDANTKLTSVTLPATLTSVADYALEHCYALATINAEASVNLVTLGANCFGDNVVQNLNLSTTKVKDLSNKPFVGHGGSGEKNKTLTTLTLPATVDELGQGLANLYNLTSVNLDATVITAVGNLAFENDKSLASLVLPATIKTVDGTTPFKGCAALATLEIPYDALTSVGAGGALFAEPATPNETLAALETLKFTKKVAATTGFKATIAAGAFSNCTDITSVSIAEGGNILAGAVLTAGAIALSNEENSTVVLGKLGKAPAAGFIAGPTATGVETTVTIGEVEVAQDQATAIISGNIGTFTVGKLSAALEVAAIGFASKIVFNGEITTALTVATPVPNNRLTEIDFGTIKINDAANIIPATAFDEVNAPNLTTVSWTPAAADIPTALVFNQKAFGTVAKDAAAMITFSTIAQIAALYPAGAGGAGNELDKNLFNVKFAAAPIPAVPVDIPVYGPEGSNSFIGYFKAPAASNYAIDKTQAEEDEQATITVYSAFIDESDNKLYMDPLQIVDGQFIVEKGQVVVIRSTKSFDVKAYTTDADNTMRYQKVGAAYNLINDLQYTAAAISADQLGTMYYDLGQYVYYLTNPATTGSIYFNILGSSYYLPAKSVYTVRNGMASARMEVVWLDSNEEATAILNVVKKNAAGNGAIYNLAGQKVDASYKGIVIKEGKKFIQK